MARSGNQMDSYRDSQLDGGVGRQIARQLDSQISSQIARWIDRQIDGQIDRQIDRQRDRQTDKQINRQIDRQTDRQITKASGSQLSNFCFSKGGQVCVQHSDFSLEPPPKLPGHFEAVSQADGYGLESCQGRPFVVFFFPVHLMSANTFRSRQIIVYIHSCVYIYIYPCIVTYNTYTLYIYTCIYIYITMLPNASKPLVEM